MKYMDDRKELIVGSWWKY